MGLRLLVNVGIELENGERVTALWTQEKITDLASYLDRPVVVEGLAVFRPSGTLLRIDAEAIAESTPADAYFSLLPHAEPQVQYVAEASRVTTGKSVYATIFGCLGAEESDEAFVAAVAEADQ